MSNKVTSVRKGIKVEDCTFRNARFQSEILNEVEIDACQDSKDTIKVPNSLTPEQVKNFYTECINNTSDANARRIYMQTVRWIEELFSLKRQILSDTVKNMNTEDKETVDDLQ